MEGADRGRRSPSRPPWSLRAVRGGLRLLGLAAPGLAGGLAIRLMVRPRRRGVDLMARLPDLTGQRIPHRAGQLQAYAWPGKRRILLVHGWDASSADFATLIRRLRQQGWGGLAYDAPGHGRSDGTETDFLDLGAALRRALWQHGPFDAILGHSFGAAVVLYQLGQRAGPIPDQLVLGGTPTSLDQVFSIYAQRLGLTPAVRAALDARITERLGQPAGAFSLPASVSRLASRCLFVHDREDPLIPATAAQMLNRAAARGQLLQTNGLGHRGWLKDEGVLDSISAFLGAAHEAAVPCRRLQRRA